MADESRGEKSAATKMSRKAKVKWTDKMNVDVLECKRKAQELTSSDRAPVNENGRKKGYIEVMKDLWNANRYEHLGLKAQNLRDQASRLEKNQERSIDISSSNSTTTEIQESIIESGTQLAPNTNNFYNKDLSNIDKQASESDESEHANSQQPTRNDLHISSAIDNNSEIPREVQYSGQTKQNEQDNGSEPGCLPEHNIVNNPSMITWNTRNDGSAIVTPTSVVTDAYNEIVKWKKNVFLVPYGKIGREFIDQVTSHINDWNAGSENHHLKTSDSPERSKVFAKLVLEGQINSALRFLGETSTGGVLDLTDDVMDQLKAKHPDPQPAKLGSLLFGPIDDEVPESVYSEINGEMVRQAALRTKGSGGPCGVDANGFRRILACKSFKQSATKLCDAMTKSLCTKYFDPETIEPLVASRLIPLDKGEGAPRPIGAGEVVRRIIGKCVMNVAKGDVVDASSSLQLCAGQNSGSEAAIHGMRTIFEADDTDAVILIDASNAFNVLNRATALHNIRVLCPIIAIYAINTYRNSARLFITGGKEIISAEGTTQGDPLAMATYALSMQPLITSSQAASSTKQCWFADDACGAGSILEIKKWWDNINTLGPSFGYFPNAKKCWIISKADKEASAREVFSGTAVNVTVQGQKHLGAFIGSRDYLEEYVNEKACNAAYTFGLKHRYTYFLRTLSDIQDLLEPLENAISNVLIPAITDHRCSPLERDVLALPVRLGGLSMTNPCLEADIELSSSVKATAPLVQQIVVQSHQLPDDSVVKSLQQAVKSERAEVLKERADGIRDEAPRNIHRALALAAEKGSSVWLTVLPLREMGYNLNKGEFRDAIKLRYDWPINDIPTTCMCGDKFTVNHAMICKRGGFISQRHNELRDLEADLLDMVCNDVKIEPVLQDITGERLGRGSNTAPDARLDIHARGFWEPQRAAFFDVRVCHPNAGSYRDLELHQIYRNHEN
ncbi:predicted protein [Nematostella vectensis]|uniref:Reverse transcriptase domain-containing protein n=1 Tax=Nematostella vectensis TaxID=45351 RepID=A7SEG6_NEMVE|nr:predicted protein [Nematostella vectensis]|eukprot:XP_001629985.1 predicted protein [Nematostella vectensis]